MVEANRDQQLAAVALLVTSAQTVTASRSQSFDLGKATVNGHALGVLEDAVQHLAEIGDSQPTRVQRARMLLQAMTTDEQLEAIGLGMSEKQLDELLADLDGTRGSRDEMEARRT